MTDLTAEARLLLALARIEELEALALLADHGTLKRYKGCRCTPCRKANAKYEQKRAKQHIMGKPPLGSLVSATEARRLVRRLEAEHISQKAIAQEGCGLRLSSLRLDTEVITLRRHLQIRRYARMKLAEEAS